MNIRMILIGGVLLASGTLARGEGSHWIWQPGAAETEGYVLFRKGLFFREVPDAASLSITVDDSYELYVNGTLAAKGSGWETMERYDIAGYLQEGKNVIGVRAENGGGQAGLVAKAEWTGGEAGTDATWRCRQAERWIWNWETLGFDDSKWQDAEVLGEFGKTAPWGDRVAAAKETVKRDPSVRVGMKALEEFSLEAGDRVLTLGGTSVERAIRYGYLETALQVSLGGERVVFRNLGWSGDDVRGSSRGRFGFQPEGFRHLKQHVSDLKPSVIVVDYGRNEAFDGEDGLGEFRRRYNELLDVLEESGARLMLVAPYRHEALGGKLPDPTSYNQNLEKYVTVIREVADQRGHWYLDLYNELPTRTKARDEAETLTYNGIHLTSEGYRRMAEVVCGLLGKRVPEWDGVEAIRRLVVKKNEQFFHRWRPQNETYLTLFRKHEQGNNYREIPQFDPIIEELEKEIAAKSAAYREEVKP